jgi:hypothetical protein
MRIARCLNTARIRAAQAFKGRRRCLIAMALSSALHLSS